jgi:hypothetical protein
LKYNMWKFLKYLKKSKVLIQPPNEYYEI